MNPKEAFVSWWHEEGRPVIGSENGEEYARRIAEAAWVAGAKYALSHADKIVLKAFGKEFAA